MENYLLPATTYELPARLARKHKLNTIIEDKSGEISEDGYSEEEKENEGRGRERDLTAPRSTESTSPVPSLTSSISSYYRSRRHSDNFDEMYDVSDDDSEISLSVMTTSMSTRSTSPTDFHTTKDKMNRCPSLVIPSPSYWPTIQKLQTSSPPRPPKIPISPAALSMLGHDLPTASNPPSLDGSLISDPLAESSAPVTPDLQIHPRSGDIWGQGGGKQGTNAGSQNTFHGRAAKPIIKIRIDNGSALEHSRFSPEDRVGVRDFGVETARDFSDSPVLGSEDGHSEFGVELPADALITLQHLSLEIPEKLDHGCDYNTKAEMEEARVPRPRPSSADITPASETSQYSISGMSIPSPSCFFSSLGSNAWQTWGLAGSIPTSALPPSSTTAENFYNCPWNKDLPRTIEHVIEVDDNDTDGPPTARQMPFRPVEDTQQQNNGQSHQPAVSNDFFGDHDEDYELAIQESAEKTLDRTSVWLAAQTSYMSALRETNPVNDISIEAEQKLKRCSSHVRSDSLGSPIRKAVRFLESETAKHELEHPKKAGPGESIYYQAFQHIKADGKKSDAFRHRMTRSDSLQAVRNCLPHEHLSRLQGQFFMTDIDRPSPQRPISMFPGRDQDQIEQTTEQKVIARVERERQALEQVNARMWIIEAGKFLTGGSLLNSPARDVLLKTPALGDIENGKVKSPLRILDLGGQPNGDWAWHCTREFPNAKVYTATTDHDILDSRIRGPRNHRRTAVTNLWALPYPNNHFDTISTRSLFTFLKTHTPPAELVDEYDLCLRECLRCLKPGGYLEFFLLDAEIVSAGSRGTAVSVEFGFNLKTRGYDPNPTKSWLGRVRRAGFDDIKRAWTFLPMGTPSKEPSMLPETPPPNVSTFHHRRVEAVHGPVGSTADAASVSGLVGSWAWEQWMLKLQIEMGKKTLLEGVGAVLEEGKGTRAGWRCLSGWARKPDEGI